MEITNRTSKQTKETIMSNMYSIARQLQAPGVQTIATFNPTRLTRTLRNLVRKSIASGKHNGGWSSQTKEVRNLVFKLAGETPVIYAEPAHGSYLSFRSPRDINPELRLEIIGLLEADCSLSKMSFEEEKKNYYNIKYAEFVKNMDERFDTNIQRLDDMSANPHYSMVIRNKALREQLVTAFLTQRTPEEVALAERIATLLDRDEEFPIPTHHHF
jgi:hypothetical protein